MESFAQLFEESLARQEMRQGEVITAEVVLIDHNFVVVNAGLKSESYVPLEEFLSDQGELEVKVGDFVQVAIEMLEDGYGATRLSRDRAKRIAAWNFLEQALNDIPGSAAPPRSNRPDDSARCRFRPFRRGGRSRSRGCCRPRSGPDARMKSVHHCERRPGCPSTPA